MGCQIPCTMVPLDIYVVIAFCITQQPSGWTHSAQHTSPYMYIHCYDACCPPSTKASWGLGFRVCKGARASAHLCDMFGNNRGDASKSLMHEAGNAVTMPQQGSPMPWHTRSSQFPFKLKAGSSSRHWFLLMTSVKPLVINECGRELPGKCRI